MGKTEERRGGGERRSGADRRKRPALSRKAAAPTFAGVSATVASWAAAEISTKYGIPIEVTAPVVGMVLAVLAGLYNKLVLPWL